MSSQNSGGSFFAGLVIGVIVGAGVTLLLAPQSGQEARSQISAKGFALKDGAVEGLTETSHRARAQANAWQEKGHNVTDAVSRSKDGIVQAVSQGKDRVVKAVNPSQ